MRNFGMTAVDVDVVERNVRLQLCDEVTDILDRLVTDVHSRCTGAIPPQDMASHLAQARAYYTARLLVRSLLIKEPH
jgi:hypothetical protein